MLVNNDHLVWDEGDTKPYKKTKLYHFTKSGEDTLSLDPARLGEHDYSRSEQRSASTHRSFFYTDPKDKEDMVSGTRYSVEVPSERIYDLVKDPAGLVGRIRERNGNIDDLLDEVKGRGFKGVSYNQGVPVVAWLEKLQVQRDKE